MTESLSRLFYLLLATGCTVSLCSRAETIYLYDLRYTAQLSRQDAFENTHLVAILSGIANRNSAVLYTLLTNADEAVERLPDEPGPVARWRPVRVSSVAWFSTTPVVYATSNVASTAGGVYDALPVCYRPNDAGSLYSVLVGEASELRLPVALNLVGLFNGSVTGSVKCDAYMWAKESMMKSIDSPGDLVRLPCLASTPGAGKSDQRLFMIHIGGFTPWAFKYTDGHSQHGHGGVETEWESVRVFTSYNAYVDADACCIGAMANAAFYQHFPLPVNMTQNPAPTMQQLMEKGYIDADGKVVPKNYCVFYAGDYDSAAWLYSQLRDCGTTP
eukprot:Em0005g1288a